MKRGMRNAERGKPEAHKRLTDAFDRARALYARTARGLCLPRWEALSFPMRCAWVNAADELAALTIPRSALRAPRSRASELRVPRSS